MDINILSGNNSPETTNVVMGMYKDKGVNIDISTVSLPAKQLYDAFFNMVGSHTSLSIVNSPYKFEGNHVTPNVVTLQSVIIDFNSLSVADKQKVHSVFALLETSI